MLYREIIAVCSQIHTKHKNTLCGQNVELLNVILVVHIVTTGLCRVNIWSVYCTHMNNTVFNKKKKWDLVVTCCSDCTIMWCAP